MKSPTDQFWNERATAETDSAKVNIADTVQRDHELQFVFKNVNTTMRMIEIGCGNGYVTQQLRKQVAHVDAFDYAENMIERARANYGEQNNRFFHDSVLDPRHAGTGYDAGLCMRVLINMRNLDEQKTAARNMARMIRTGGHLILIEGFRDGFDFISSTRKNLGLSELQPAKINYYSYTKDLMPTILQDFEIKETWHSGMFDFLTRVVYPQLVGADRANEPGEFHHKIEPIVRFNALPDLSAFARLHGFVLVRK